MNPNDTTAFGLYIAAVVTQLPPYRELTETVLEAYSIGMEGVPTEAVKRARDRALRECKFSPSPAELRELAGEMLPADRAVRAWAVVARAASHYGEGPSLDFDDPLTNATIRNLGGWEAFLATWDAEPTTWVRKNFERIYISLCRSGIRAQDGGRLIGFHERNTRLNGYQDFRGYRDGKLITDSERRTWEPPPPIQIACHLPPVRVAIEGPPATGDSLALLEVLGGVGRLPEQ